MQEVIWIPLGVLLPLLGLPAILALIGVPALLPPLRRFCCLAFLYPASFAAM